jgi:hypothetical protein
MSVSQYLSSLSNCDSLLQYYCAISIGIILKYMKCVIQALNKNACSGWFRRMCIFGANSLGS